MLAQDKLTTFVILLPIFLGSLTLHELAHGWVAYRLGDSTARDAGRLTLNPVAHLDPIGSLLFVLSYWSGGYLFGWAKPVPVDPYRLRLGPQRGMAIVGAAGPITNFLLALVFAYPLAHGSYGTLTTDVLAYALLANIVLGLFNLLPVPPLDGSRIVGGLMGRRTYQSWLELDRYGVLILLGMFFVFHSEFETLLQGATNHALRIISNIVGGTPLVA